MTVWMAYQDLYMWYVVVHAPNVSQALSLGIHASGVFLKPRGWISDPEHDKNNTYCF